MSDRANAADRLSRERVRILTALMVAFAAQQATVSVNPPTRLVEMVGLGASLLMAACLLVMLRTGGMMLRAPELRRLANDEVTQANRGEAFEWGFTGAMAMAIMLSVVAALTATPVLVALRLVVLVGLYAATFRFVQLENQALA